MRRSRVTKRIPKLVAIVLVTLFSSGAIADPYILSNGLGDGTVTVGVDGYGSFGGAVSADATDAIYDPVGEINESGTVFESALFMSGPAAWLSTGFAGFGFEPEGPGEIVQAGALPTDSLPNPVITGDSTTAISTFTHGFASFHLEQRLIDSFDSDGVQLGTVLDQRYTITNQQNVPNSFTLTRYLDGDLNFDGTISDGGGLLTRGGNRILFETDASSGSAASTTFVGITAVGGMSTSANARYEIDEYANLLDKIPTGVALSNSITNDFDNDDFIDEAYDVTLALSNFIELPANGSVVYTTQTLFGNAIPPAPGSSEALPLLPGNDEPPFVFEIEIPNSNEIIWFDPVVAVGYEYEVRSGANFASVTMPTDATVPQIGQYQLEVLVGTDFAAIAQLDPGELFTFDVGGVDLFRITNISPELGLDPNNPIAFPTGLSFAAAGLATITMTPISVPELGSLKLLSIALLGCINLRRRRRAC